MTKIISFALGNIWRWDKTKNRDKLIPYAKALNINGVEITFSSKEDLYAFKLNEKNERWLKSLDYLTVHAPFRLLRESTDEKDLIKQLDLISWYNKKLKAKNVIIHPSDLPEPKILNRYDFKILTENLPKSRNVTIPDLKKIFKTYPKIGFCLDVSHAYLWSKYETGKLIEAFKDKIAQIHFSGTYRHRDHQSLQIVTDNFMDSIKPIIKLNVPIIIEEDIEKKDTKLLHKEVKFIKKLLKNF